MFPKNSRGHHPCIKLIKQTKTVATFPSFVHPKLKPHHPLRNEILLTNQSINLTLLAEQRIIQYISPISFTVNPSPKTSSLKKLFNLSFWSGYMSEEAWEVHFALQQQLLLLQDKFHNHTKHTVFDTTSPLSPYKPHNSAPRSQKFFPRKIKHTRYITHFDFTCSCWWKSSWSVKTMQEKLFP